MKIPVDLNNVYAQLINVDAAGSEFMVPFFYRMMLCKLYNSGVGKQQYVRREQQLVKKMHLQYMLTPYNEVFNDDGAKWAQMYDYPTCGNVYYFVLRHATAIPTAQRYHIFGSLFCDWLVALKALHEMGYIHTNISTSSLYVTVCSNYYRGKIGGFCYAYHKSAPQPRIAFCGAQQYFSAPEFLANMNYDESIDVWSLGIVFMFMLTGNYPFSGYTVDSMLTAQYYWQHLSFPADTPYLFCNIISNMLSVNPKNRMKIYYLLDMLAGLQPTTV